MLSSIEKMIFLKEVTFFQSMTLDQLKVLATLCEEVLFAEGMLIYDVGDAGGILYVVVTGRVGIEKRDPIKNTSARLETIEPRFSFGELNLFDSSPHTASAVALQDTLTLRLRREPLVALIRQYPDMALELIKIISQRLRTANQQVAMSQSPARQINKVFDRLE